MHTRNPVILVVDDEPIMRKMAELVLKDSFDIYLADSAEKALDSLARMDISFDVVITDIKMPGIGGSELIDTINSKYNSVDVIAMTGDLGLSQLQELRNQNKVTGVLKKPWTKKEATMIINDVVHAQRSSILE